MNKKTDTKYYFIKRVSVESSKFINLPSSIEKYSSEYHYLWSVIHDFYISDDKENLEVLLSLPNAVRRFIELYTYSKIPGPSRMSVDQRADLLFGSEESKRILKVLHHFSHLNNISRMSQNSDLLVDIDNVVNEVVNYVKNDTLHYDALMSALS